MLIKLSLQVCVIYKLLKSHARHKFLLLFRCSNLSPVMSRGIFGYNCTKTVHNKHALDHLIIITGSAVYIVSQRWKNVYIF